MQAQAPGPHALRAFGLVLGAMFAAIFGLLLPAVLGRPWPLWPWLVLAALAAWALVHPASLRLPHAAWMRIGHVLGAVNNRILLGLVFFLMITPVGLLRRLFGKDPMQRRFDPKAASYRATSARRPPSSMERPF